MRAQAESIRMWWAGGLLGAFFGTAAVSFALGACTVGSRSQVQLLHEADSILSVIPSHEAGYDYVVSVENIVDPNFKPDDKQSRDRIAVARMKKRCPLAEIVGETVIESGQWLSGRPKRIYAIQIKC